MRPAANRCDVIKGSKWTPWLRGAELLLEFNVVHLVRFPVSVMLFQLKIYFHALKCLLQLCILIQMNHFNSRC